MRLFSPILIRRLWGTAILSDPHSRDASAIVLSDPRSQALSIAVFLDLHSQVLSKAVFSNSHAFLVFLFSFRFFFALRGFCQSERIGTKRIWTERIGAERIGMLTGLERSELRRERIGTPSGLGRSTRI